MEKENGRDVMPTFRDRVYFPTENDSAAHRTYLERVFKERAAKSGSNESMLVESCVAGALAPDTIEGRQMLAEQMGQIYSFVEESDQPLDYEVIAGEVGIEPEKAQATAELMEYHGFINRKPSTNGHKK